jgi:hypothetical protein
MSLLFVHGFLLIFVILTRKNMRIQIPIFFVVGMYIQNFRRTHAEYTQSNSFSVWNLLV